jgi:hypothetical protein
LIDIHIKNMLNDYSRIQIFQNASHFLKKSFTFRIETSISLKMRPEYRRLIILKQWNDVTKKHPPKFRIETSISLKMRPERRRLIVLKQCCDVTKKTSTKLLSPECCLMGRFITACCRCGCRLDRYSMCVEHPSPVFVFHETCV